MECCLCGVFCENCVTIHGRLLWEVTWHKANGVIIPETIEECPSRKDVLNAIEKRNEAVHKAQQECQRLRAFQRRLL